MKIAICDDETTQIEYINNLITQWKKSRNLNCQMENFASAEEYIFKYPSGSSFDVYILDIQMKDMNGMELAKYIRKLDRKAKIIFLTGIKDYVFEGYEVGATRYILKPLEESIFYNTLDRIYEEYQKEPDNYFIFTYLGDAIKLTYEEIILVSVDGHYLNMRTIEKAYQWKNSLQKMREVLNRKEFVLANRSVLINVMHIDKITKTDCYMTNQIIVPISRNNYKEVNQAFIDYYM